MVVRLQKGLPNYIEKLCGGKKCPLSETAKYRQQVGPGKESDGHLPQRQKDEGSD